MANQNVGQLPAMSGAAVDPANDRLYLWDSSETGAARSKAITPAQLPAAISALLGSVAGLSYAGNGGKFLRVNAGEDAFELASVSAGSGSTNIQQTVKSDTFSLNDTSFNDITGFSVEITPGTTDRKILVIASMVVGTDTAAAAQFRLRRNSTDILVGDAAGSRTVASAEAFSVSDSEVQHVTLVYLDSPATASAVTYGVQVRCTGAANVHLNRTESDTDASAFARYASTIIALEVG